MYSVALDLSDFRKDSPVWPTEYYKKNIWVEK